jgi:hypothetical protein
MTQRDWDVLPAPVPWKSIHKDRFGGLWGIAVMFWILGVFSLLLFWGSGMPMAIGLIMSLTLIIGGAILPTVGYILSTDGIEQWEIRLPTNFDLCIAMESRIDTMLEEKNYRFKNIAVYSEYSKKKSKEPYGRAYRIITGPKAPSPGQLQTRKNSYHRIILDFTFRHGSKYVKPYLTMELRNIQSENYQFVLILQRDIMQVLTALKYQSYRNES